MKTVRLLSLTFASSLALTFVSLVSAQEDVSAGLLTCSAIEGTDARLACYDKLADDTTAPVSSSTDNWDVSVDTNPVDDSQTVVLVNDADEGSSSSRFGQPVGLVLRCKSGEIEAYIVWNDYLGSSDDGADVISRVGSSPASSDNWTVSTDSQATFYPGGEQDAVDFINSLAASDNGKYVAQVTPYSESPKTAVFNVGGLSGLTDQLFGACQN